MDDGAKCHGRTKGYEVEFRLISIIDLAFYEIPRGKFGELFRAAVCYHGAGGWVNRFSVGKWVPMVAGVGEFRVWFPGDIENGSKGRGESDSSYLAAGFRTGGENGFDAVDSRNDEFLFIVLSVVRERLGESQQEKGIRYIASI